MVNRPELALDCRCELGEGPIWDHRIGRLLFADINGHRIHTFDPASRAHDTFECGEYVSAIALASHGYIVTLQHDIAWFDGARIGERPLTVESGKRTRFNDGYVDPGGRFWAGTMSLERKPAQGALYRIDMNPAPIVTRVLRDVTTSNGVDWSSNGRLMYYVDTGTRAIDVFDFDVERGTIANRRTFVAFPEADGKPDGLVLDEEDCVWIALWQGSAVRRYAPDGRLLLQIDLPVSCPTKCAFGGADLDELYITTARTVLSDEQRAEQPHAGSLFVARAGVRGRRAREFAVTPVR
jgi:sugar lactone lactonase YvrE